MNVRACPIPPPAALGRIAGVDHHRSKGVIPMKPFSPLDLLTTELPGEDVPPDQVTQGSPRVGTRALAELSGTEIGIWEMTEGGMRDVEIDEVLVVLDGEATVTLLVEGEDAGRIELRAGSLCRLDAGSTTRWDVSRTLRKVYVIEKEATRA